MERDKVLLIIMTPVVWFQFSYQLIRREIITLQKKGGGSE